MGTFEIDTNEFERLAKIEPNNSEPNAYFILERSRQMLFLLDTGASKSILPGKIFAADEPCSTILKGVTGATMKAEGKLHINLEFNLPISFVHEFLIADIPICYGILGCDFFEQNKLRLCATTSTLTHVSSNCSIDIIKSSRGERSARKLMTDLQGHSPNVIMKILSNEISTADNIEGQSEILLREAANKYQELFEEPSYFRAPKHKFILDIELEADCPSIYHRPRKAPAAERKAIKENFEKLERQGVVIRSSSNFASPVTAVKKKNGEFRICVDYTKLNQFTKSLNFPLPLISNLQSVLTKTHKWFSTLDLKSAYYSLPMTKRASERAAIITHEGTFLPLRSPFGLKNSPSKFCELIAAVIDGMGNYVFAYLDDFLIFSTTFEEHQQHMDKLLDRLRSNGLFLNKKKCIFGKSRVMYLGHEISSEGLRPLKEKLELYANLKPPKNVKELRSFIGIVNYYREHCKGFAEIVAPINKLLSKVPSKKHALIPWDDNHQIAFESTIKALQKADTLSFDEVNKPLVLTTDASATHGGATLEQFIDNNYAKSGRFETKPLAYFSQAFSTTTKVRSTFNRELTALYMAVRHFRFRIRGREIIFRTDHKSLINALSNPEGQHSPEERRMIYHLKEYLPTLMYLPGGENVVADFLSRPEHHCRDIATQTSDIIDIGMVTEHSIPPPLTISLISQKQDQETIDRTDLEAELPSGERLVTKSVTDGDETFSLLGALDDSTDQFRPYLPQSLRFLAFQELHGKIHQGKDKTHDVVSANYFWPELKLDVTNWTKVCPICQKCKISRHSRQKLQFYPTDFRRLSVVHVDLMGPLPVSDDYSKYVLTIRDRGTGFLITAPLTDKSTLSVIAALRGHFISSFGVPTIIISDNGREWNSNEFDTFCTNLGIKHKFVTAYHPQANGMVERIHRTMKVAFRGLDEPSQWADALPLITLAINNQVCDNNDFTPYQMVFGQAARLPGTFFFKDDGDENPSLQSVAAMKQFSENMRHLQRSARKQKISNAYVNPDLFTVPEILVRDDGNKAPLSKLYTGPFAVIAKTSKYFTIDTDRGAKNISVDRLKPFYRLPSDDHQSGQNVTDDESVCENRGELSDAEPVTDDSEVESRSVHQSGYFLRKR